MDLTELTNFLSASVCFFFIVSFKIYLIMTILLKLTIVGKIDQTGHLDPKICATNVFNELGVNVEKKLSKDQFINGYILICFCLIVFIMLYS